MTLQYSIPVVVFLTWTCPIVQAENASDNSTTAQFVSVIIGDGNPAPANAQPGSLSFPFAVAFDSEDNMLIAEYTGGRVLRQAPSGELEVIAGTGKSGYSGDNGPATQARFHDLHNLAITPDDTIYLSDHENSAVRRIDPHTGLISTFAGSGRKGYGGDGQTADHASLNQVMCVTLTPDSKHLIVTDLQNRRVRLIDLATRVITTIAGNGKTGTPRDGQLAVESPLLDPRAAAMDNRGNLYIVERNGHALRRVGPDGKIETVAGTGKPGSQDGPALQAQMAGPKHLAIDGEGNVYIADDNNHLIRKYDPQAKTLSTVLGQGEFKLQRPHGVTIHDGELYIADSWHHRILKMPLP